MRANIERIYDEFERKSREAIMTANAVNARKRVKPSDLFKRPKDGTDKRNDLTDLRKETDRLNDWLATLRPNNEGKEETNGD